MDRVSLSKTKEDAGGIFVIDGSMSTALEDLGCDLNNRLWTAKILAEQPEKVRQVHMDYFEAGADCGITASYQASIPGLMEAGYTEEEAEDILKRSVRIFLNARDEWVKKHPDRPTPLCLAACGPYGAYMADGSEYRGHYGVSAEALRKFHKRRAELLWESGADILLFETQPSLEEAKIEAEIAEEMGADYWISFSCMDGTRTCEGTPIRECAELFSEGYPHLRMIGVNCTKPEYISSLIRELKAATDLPIGVYPNSGETYDPKTKTWTHNAAGENFFGKAAYGWMMDGASAVGGCCTTVGKHVRMVKDARDRYYEAGCPTR